MSHVEIGSINEQYMNEFLEALQASINRMSAEGERISFVVSKGTVLSRHMSEVLDEEWKRERGFEVMSVGLASISYDAESQKLINMRNQGAMLGDPNVREGYVQGAIARGLEAAGSNRNGAMAGFMGMGAGMNAGGGFMGVASAANMQQMNAQAGLGGNAGGAARSGNTSGGTRMGRASAGGVWVCRCGAGNTGKFCSECGSPRPEKEAWVCKCGAHNTGKFCSECGSPKPDDSTWVCRCGAVNTGRFCTECGNPKE